MHSLLTKVVKLKGGFTEFLVHSKENTFIPLQFCLFNFGLNFFLYNYTYFLLNKVVTHRILKFNDR